MGESKLDRAVKLHKEKDELRAKMAKINDELVVLIPSMDYADYLEFNKRICQK